MKTISTRTFAAVKRVAMNVNPLVSKKLKNQEKIDALYKEIEDLDKEIAAHETGIKALTGGYTSEDLVVKVVELNGKLDAKGNPAKSTKYVPSQMVTYDEENNQYIINEMFGHDEELEKLNVDANDAHVDMVESNEDTIGVLEDLPIE